MRAAALRTLPWLFCLLVSANATATFAAVRFTPVSLTKVDTEQYIAADYKQLYSLRKVAGDWTLKTMSVVFREDVPIGMYNPTGVYYSPELKILFIANYNGHNVLLASVAGDSGVVEIIGEIRRPGFVSPENVHVDARRNLVAIADYDAQAIFLLDLGGKLVWKRSLDLAHGVYIGADAVYATGLGTEKLARFSFRGDRKHVPESELSQLRYPTVVNRYPGQRRGDHRLMIVDAHLGKVIVYDRHLRRIREFGRNGPGSGFLRPYGAIVDPAQHELLVADTFKNRIAFYDLNGNFLNQVGIEMPKEIGQNDSWAKEIAPFCSTKTVPKPLAQLLRTAYGFSSEAGIYAGYQRLCLVYEGTGYSALLPWNGNDYTSPNRPAIGLAWIHEQNVDNRHLVLLGSPEFPEVMVYEANSGIYYKESLPEDLLVWGPGTLAAQKLLSEVAQNAVRRSKPLLARCGGNPFAAFIWDSLSQDERTSVNFDQALDKLLYWKNTDAVLSRWRSGQRMEGVLSTWAGNSLIVLEDAILVDLMTRYDPVTTQRAFTRCQS